MFQAPPYFDQIYEDVSLEGLSSLFRAAKHVHYQICVTKVRNPHCTKIQGISLVL